MDMKINDDTPRKHTIFANNPWMLSRKECSPMKTSSFTKDQPDMLALYDPRSHSSNWLNPMALLAKKVGKDDSSPNHPKKAKNKILQEIQEKLPEMKVQNEIGGTNTVPVEVARTDRFFDETSFRKSIKKSINKKQENQESAGKIRKVSILSINSNQSLQEASPKLVANHQKRVQKPNIFMPVTVSRQDFDNSHYNNQKYQNKRFHTEPELSYEGELKRLREELKKSEIIINSMKIKELEGEIAKLKEKDQVHDKAIAQLVEDKHKKSEANVKDIKDEHKQIQKKPSQARRMSSLDKYAEEEKQSRKKSESEKKLPQTEQKRAKTEMRDQQLVKSSKQQKEARNYHVLADHHKQIQTQKQFMLINPEKTRERLEKCYYQLRKHTIPEIKINPYRIPKIPNPPRHDQSLDDYLRLAKQLCTCLNYQVEQIDIVIRRYKNCLSFRLIDKGLIVVWGFDGKLYVGDWVQLKEGEGKKQGSGMEFTSNYYYKGDFQENKKSGVGTIQFYNGNVYEGEWRNGKMQGSGVYFEKTGSTYYQGEWDRGQLRGRGLIKYTKKHFYTGEVNNFTKCGKGTQFYENGDIYEGSYEKGEQNGYGIYYSASGQFYVGYFKNSLRNGTGLLLSNKFTQVSQKDRKQESYYYGQFFQGVRSGYGIEKNQENSYYLGYFFKDLPHGPGILQDAVSGKDLRKNGLKISGIWKNGKMAIKNKNVDQSHSSQTFTEKN